MMSRGAMLAAWWRSFVAAGRGESARPVAAAPWAASTRSPPASRYGDRLHRRRRGRDCPGDGARRADWRRLRRRSADAAGAATDGVRRPAPTRPHRRRPTPTLATDGNAAQPTTSADPANELGRKRFRPPISWRRPGVASNERVDAAEGSEPQPTSRPRPPRTGQRRGPGDVTDDRRNAPTDRLRRRGFRKRPPLRRRNPTRRRRRVPDSRRNNGRGDAAGRHAARREPPGGAAADASTADAARQTRSPDPGDPAAAAANEFSAEGPTPSAADEPARTLALPRPERRPAAPLRFGRRRLGSAAAAQHADRR